MATWSWPRSRMVDGSVRLHAATAYVALACAAASVGFVACGSDVDDTAGNAGSTASAGGAGGTGQGGGPPTGGPGGSTASSTTTGNPMTSSSSGPGDKCEEACAKASDCGYDFCSRIPIPFDCGFTQAACAADCILDADCAAISTLSNLQTADPVLAGCLQGCLGGGQGGAGGGGQDCETCAVQGCFNQLLACQQDADCGGWLGCVQQCMDSACTDACDAQFPAAAGLYGPVYTCLCQSCSTECGAANPCSKGGGGGAGGMGQGGMGQGGMGQGGMGQGGMGQGGGNGP